MPIVPSSDFSARAHPRSRAGTRLTARRFSARTLVRPCSTPRLSARGSRVSALRLSARTLVRNKFIRFSVSRNSAFRIRYSGSLGFPRTFIRSRSMSRLSTPFRIRHFAFRIQIVLAYPRALFALKSLPACQLARGSTAIPLSVTRARDSFSMRRGKDSGVAAQRW